MATAMPNGRQRAARSLAVLAADSKVTEACRAGTGYIASRERSRAKASRYASRAAGPSPAPFTRSTNSVTSRSSSVEDAACISSRAYSSRQSTAIDVDCLLLVPTFRGTKHLGHVVPVETEGDVMRDSGASPLHERRRVQYQQIRCGGSRVEHDGEDHAVVLSRHPRRLHEDGLTGIATLLVPCRRHAPV